MNEQEFYVELRKKGLEENDIKGLYSIYLKIKENDKDLTLDEWFNRALQAHKEIKKEIIILLCGGDKRTQQADIANAKKIAKLYEEE